MNKERIVRWSFFVVGLIALSLGTMVSMSLHQCRMLLSYALQEKPQSAAM